MLKKSNSSMKAGLVWVPYTIQTTVATVSCGTSSMYSHKTLTSRYSTIMIKSRNLIRKNKIEKIIRILS